MSVEEVAAPASTKLHADLARIVGDANVRADLPTRTLHSEDIWQPAGAVVELVVAPGSTGELAQVVAAAHAADFAISPRGAGMSYTGGYIPESARTISLDMRRMNRILRISREDMTVTVEAGASWLALNEALSAQGLRTPYWGPMSGVTSTIGGGLSQLNAMFGAGQHGTSSESVVALTVVLGDGTLVRTGARGPDGDTPHYRHFGPDLTGLFCGDCGAFGIKAEITLRLMQQPAFEDHVSFAFPTADTMLAALAEIARAGIAAETCGFDPSVTALRMKRDSIAADVKTLGKVVAKEKNLGKGLLAAAKIAMAGRDFIPPTDFPLHLTCEGRSKGAVEADMAEARRIAASFRGKEVENTIAKVLRTIPFPPLNVMLGPTGEAWAPVHGLCSLSLAPKVFSEIQNIFTSCAEDLRAHDVQTGFLFTTMSTNGLIIEPLFYWPRGWRAIHETAVEPAHLARLTRRGDDPEGTALVTELRARVIDVFARHGCGHFQIGRSYPYRQSRDAGSKTLLDAIKARVDPDNILNPGVIGFPARQ